MSNPPVKMRQLVDWSAALWAALIAGTIFLIINLFVVPQFMGGANHWMMLRYFGSIVLGSQVLAPPATYDGTVLIAALITHYVLSIGFTLLLAYIIHRWGLLAGIVLGGLFGLGLYSINYYTVTTLFPWFFALAGTPMAVAHAVFGALAGGIYEGLEVEEFVPVEEA